MRPVPVIVTAPALMLRPAALTTVDVVVIGAGQAGLSAAYHLRRLGLPPGSGFVVLDRNPAPGGAWQHRWPSLRLGRAHGIYPLPGLPMTEADQAEPAAVAVPRYFDAYERRFALDVRRPVAVTAVRPDGDRLLVETAAGPVFSAGAVINATGTWDRPFVPYYPGAPSFRGLALHAAQYAGDPRGAERFRGRHVVVVGAGTTAIELLTEISDVTTTTWVTRRPPVFRTGEFGPELGRAAVARVEEAVRNGRPPGSVVGVTGLHLTPAIAAAQAKGYLDRLPMFDRITPDGVAWDDPARFIAADVILWCTGFRAALEHLAPLRLREPGGGITVDGTTAVREPRLQLVGYGPSASTIGANRAGRVAARAALRQL